MTHARTGAVVSNEEILGFAKLFNDELTLDNISRPRLVNMCKYMGIQPYGTDAYLRYMLRKRFRWIKSDDKMIEAKGGVDVLTDDEVREDCRERERGMVGLHTVEKMRHKTYTIWELSSDQQGLTPCVFGSLFFRMNEEQNKHAGKQLMYQCRCSFLEIYNEQITDLLDPAQRNLQIREDTKTGVYVENLTEESVSSIKDVTKLLKKVWILDSCLMKDSSALFDLNVPFVCAINQRHKVGVESMGVGALKLTGYLREQMQQRNLNFSSLYTVRTLKEKLCYVAIDYECELRKDTEASYEVHVEGLFTLKQEKFRTGEILFQPRIAGLRTASGLHQAVAIFLEHCHAAGLTPDETWFKTIVLAGGTACLPGGVGWCQKACICSLFPHLTIHIWHKLQELSEQGFINLKEL
ncbi:unnamed protein product [Lactuca virosa]|uniref:Kinesin motor domain-containing protein n=1 Tax=Lactuca virosa TaxID=75947 RepID=A0AAU9NKC3_9ASTR|nr:unnamed protein product [Lactuca virosa]